MLLVGILAFLVLVDFHPPTGTDDILQILLRWVHVLAGITWVGLLYFFNLVNVPFMKEVDAGMKPKIFQGLTLRALWWFRWGAMVTVVVGIAYWMVLLAGNVQSARSLGMTEASMGKASWSFFLIWMVAWAIINGLLTPLKGALNSGPVLAVIIGIVVAAASYLYVAMNPEPWWSNNVLAIGVGGGMGLIMLLNVWGIIWRNSKKIIRGTLAGSPPANAANLARQAFLASRTNFFLSIPMLFFMVSASHYAMFGK